MKKSNKKSTQTDGSSGAKMSVEDKIETKMKIAELRRNTSEFCVNAELHWRMCRALLTWRFVVSSRTLAKEYAKLGISMTDLPEKQKEAWK